MSAAALGMSAIGGRTSLASPPDLPPERRSPELLLKFGLYSHDARTVTLGIFVPILEYLGVQMSQKLSRSVRINMRIYETYEDGRRALVYGAMDFMRLGAASYVKAKAENPGISLLVNQKEEESFPFNGVIFTQKKSGIWNLEDLRGRSFAFGDPNSTTGCYLAQAELLDAGIRAEDLKCDYLLQHQKVVDAVLSGRFAAGAAKRSVFEKFREKPPGLRAIKDFDSTGTPFVARSELDAEVGASICLGLLSGKDGWILDASGRRLGRFEETTDKHYDLVRYGMEKSEHFLGGAGGKGF